ncbi:helix-turn-helix domain-containing protein [Pseudarthrobacter sp. PS3-L1]|uniref:helix-turn-helix domain-containing protein n=1 Tax=Pseudarthrobacter sp. PS3-L1 TaxID=3046207 RepID=UPI0024BA73E9|nr:helix-turn-helix domain-containing protein [Pseudarthrobacter sp. PS3-L1]MDJ0319526.1 helix-turn-helix domain-containing protein [Pseudarthrobacter sp. PS3-L1]
MTTHHAGNAQSAQAALRDFRPERPLEPEWTELLESLWKDRNLLVKDFLSRFSAISYGDALVPPEDIYQTAADTMDMFLFQMAGLPLPADLQALPREVASRRARQGVPLDAFLEAIRNDFRVLWKGLERVAGTTGIGVLVANMDLVLDAVEGYVSSIQQAYAEEEARLARNKQLYRQRLLSRLFNADLGGPTEVRELAAALGVQGADTFEVLAVTAESVAHAQRHVESDHRTYAYENAGVLYLFRQQRKGRTWSAEAPPFPAGYVPGVKGLAAVPAAAASALVLAQHQPGSAGLATMENTWMGIAGGLLEQKFADFSEPIRHALDNCTPLERQRLLQVARSYARTGSIKETSEELFCHRNTVVNRLHSLHELIGLDLTVPAQAARALITLSRYEGSID